ncbi:MAG: Aminopeptidase YpdF [Chlamydiae bacterium]|nr:Aminopeptidase YpdF [Chlamydiota bacterium]
MDYQKRLYALGEILEEDSIDGVLIEDTTDIFYLTGVELSTGRLIVHNRGAHLIVDGRYYESCSKIHFLTVVLWEPDFLTDLFLEDLSHIKSFAFCSEKTTYQRFLDLEKIAEVVHKEQPHRDLELMPSEDFVLQLRCVKNPEEVELLAEAADLGSKGFDFICSILKEGISELDVVRELIIFWRKNNAQGISFDPIIAFGSSSSMPHYHPSDKKLEMGMPVLVDIGVKLRHYHSDMTRVVFLGEPDPKMKEIYEIVKGAQEAALKLCKPGTRVGDLDMEARIWISDRGYGEYFSHGLGHGIGLDVHELPVIRSATKYDAVVLQPGMAITVEPGIYLPQIGGVRIEDTVVITSDGHRNLTNRPKEITIIE